MSPPLFRFGSHKLASGRLTNVKIDCDALTDDDWEAIAFLARCLVTPYRAVEGVPRGGEKLAEALRPYVRHDGGLLIVDDVLTTGGSMEHQRAGRTASGIVLFSRAAPQDRPHWIQAIFQLNPLLVDE